MRLQESPLNKYMPIDGSVIVDPPDMRPILKFWPSINRWTARDRHDAGLELWADSADEAYAVYQRVLDVASNHSGWVTVPQHLHTLRNSKSCPCGGRMNRAYGSGPTRCLSIYCDMGDE